MNEGDSEGRLFGGFHEAALDSLPVNVVVLDGEGVIVETNEAWNQFARDNGLETDAVGVDYLRVCDVSNDENAERAAAGIRSVLDGERDLFTMEYPCHSPTERRWFAMRASRFTDGGDRYLAVAHVDVTERKLAKLQAEEKAQELETTRDDLTMLNQVVRHDIRNEMSVVLTWTQMLAEYVPDDAREGIEYVRDASEQIVELTRSVGDLTAVVADEDEFASEPVALAAIIRSEVERLRARNATRDAAVTVTGVDNLPEVAVLADDMLSSAFVNVLNNAVIHNDGDRRRVDISVTEREETVVVRVADDGPGIPDDRKEAVFGRGDKGLESDGTGLGLYLIDKTIRRYGGEVSLEDNDPQGTVVCIELPLA